MIQQTANQFSEGMNLDTHPIAINNQQLASALNATMVTMNGNELVLQNDMGNGRVESAYLPAGYVPVGMTEFGGIIYVASHNPLTGQSQIGSFPSPERNISSDEISNGANKTFQRFSSLSVTGQYPYLQDNELYIASLAQKLGIRVDNPIRPGDKFSIEMEDSEDFITLLKLLDIKALNLYPCTINSDGAFVKIEDLIEDYKYWIKDDTISNYDNGGQQYSSFVYCRNIGNDRRYNVYKNKIVGDLYLKLDIGVPDNIPYYITANSENGQSEYTILMPQLPNISKYRVYVTTTEGEEYYIDTDQESIDGQFVIGTKDGNSEDISYFYGVDNATKFYTITHPFSDLEKKEVIHNYVIIPYFRPGSNIERQLNLDEESLDKNSGYLINMAVKGSINLSKLGRGIVNFNQFRYYNNTTDGIFTLSYSMETYLKSSQIISQVDLCTIDYNRLLNQDGSLNTSIIQLTEEDGLYSTVIGNSKISYFGNFQQSVAYNDGLKVGKVYIGFLRAKIQTQVDNEVQYKYSKPFIIFTSSISNYLFSSNMEQYIDAASGNNPVDGENKPKEADESTNTLWDDYIGIPCRINWKYSVDNSEVKTETETSGYTIPFDSPVQEVHFKQKKTGTIKYTLNPIVELRFGNDFPLDTSKVDAHFIDNSIEVNEDATTYSYNPELVGTHSNNNLDQMLTSPVLEQDCNNSEFYRVTYDSSNRTLSCGVRVVSEFEGGTIGVEEETITGNAFVPLLDPGIRSTMLMQDLYTDRDGEITDPNYDENNPPPTYYELSRWFSFYTYKGDAGSHSRKASHFVDTILDTGEDEDAYVGYSADVNKYIINHDSEAVETTFEIKTQSPAWSKFIIPYREKYQERYGDAPLITFEQPTDNSRTQFNVDYSKDVCIPMLIDTAGVYRPIEDIGFAVSSPGHLGYVTNLVNMYQSNGLIMQENQVYTLSYRYTNSNDIIYSKPYYFYYNVKVKGNLFASLGDQFPAGAIISAIYQTVGDKTKVIIQAATQQSEQYNNLNEALSSIATYATTNAVKLPKMALIDAQNNVKVFDEAIIPITISSPDIEQQVATFLSSNHAEQNNPAIIDGTLVGTTDCLGKQLTPNMMYFVDQNNVLYSSETLSQLSRQNATTYQGSINGQTITYVHPNADTYVKLSIAISRDGIIKVLLDKAYNQLRGLYIDFGKAKTNSYVVPNNNDGDRYDKIGQQKISLGRTYQGIKVALVGKANAYTPQSSW